MSQKLVKFEAKIRQRLVESRAKIKQFGGYNVFIIQDERHRNLKYFYKIILKNKNL